MMAGSSVLAGAKPLAWICAALPALCQSSLVAMTALSEERTSVNVGLASGFEMPKLASDGPAAVITSVLLAEPQTMKPAIITSLPVNTCPRVEMFASRGGLLPAMLPVSPAKFRGEFVAVDPSRFRESGGEGNAGCVHTSAPSPKVMVPPPRKKKPLGTV